MNDFLEEKRALMRDWIETSENIRDRFGLEKALGYLVGEKFYHMIRYSKLIIANCNQAAYEDLLTEARIGYQSIRPIFANGRCPYFPNVPMAPEPGRLLTLLDRDPNVPLIAGAAARGDHHLEVEGSG